MAYAYEKHLQTSLVSVTWESGNCFFLWIWPSLLCNWTQDLAMATIIQRLDWGWRSCLWEGSLTWLASWCWLFAETFSFSPHGFSVGLFEHPYNMATDFPKGESDLEHKAEASISLWLYLKRQHHLFHNDPVIAQVSSIPWRIEAVKGINPKSRASWDAIVEVGTTLWKKPGNSTRGGESWQGCPSLRSRCS